MLRYFLVSMIVTGCATPIIMAPLPIADKSSSEVLIYRKWGFMNAGLDLIVKVNKFSVGLLPNDEFVKFHLTPGIHTVELYSGDSFGLALVQAEPGKKHCFTYHMPLTSSTEAFDLIPKPCAEVERMIENKRGVSLN